MKTTLNISELKALDACADGFKKFKQAHGDKAVTLTQAFESNGWNDIWWYIGEAYESFSYEQKKDLRLLAADYAERVLPVFESRMPDDERPRLAINAARDYANGLIGDADWAAGDAARAARAAAWSAWAAARAGAWAAARAAGDDAGAGAWAGARAAAWAAARAAGDDAGDYARAAAWAAARAAGDDAWAAARAAAWAAARAAGDGAWAGAWAAGDDAGAERKWQEDQLLKLFSTWEAL